MANSKSRISVHADGLEGFIRRGRQRAAALDNGQPLPAEQTLTFKDPEQMFRVLTPKRFEILKKLADSGSVSITALAHDLNRNRSAVSRDLEALVRVGAARTASVPNSGHGRMIVASPVAARLELVSVIGSGARRA